MNAATPKVPSGKGKSATRRKRRGPVANRKSSAWISRDLREALYRRDGHRCVYCGIHQYDLPNGHHLTLDHKTPAQRYRGKFWPNHPSNLLTSCKPCNSAKGERTLAEFARDTERPELDSRMRNHLRKSWQLELEALRMERRVEAAVRQRLIELENAGRIRWVELEDQEPIPF